MLVPLSDVRVEFPKQAKFRVAGRTDDRVDVGDGLVHVIDRVGRCYIDPNVTACASSTINMVLFRKGFVNAAADRAARANQYDLHALLCAFASLRE